MAKSIWYSEYITKWQHVFFSERRWNWEVFLWHLCPLGVYSYERSFKKSTGISLHNMTFAFLPATLALEDTGTWTFSCAKEPLSIIGNEHKWATNGHHSQRKYIIPNQYPVCISISAMSIHHHITSWPFTKIKNIKTTILIHIVFCLKKPQLNLSTVGGRSFIPMIWLAWLRRGSAEVRLWPGTVSQLRRVVTVWKIVSFEKNRWQNEKNPKKINYCTWVDVTCCHYLYIIYIIPKYDYDCIILTGQLGMFARPRTAASENFHSSPFPSKYVILLTTTVKLSRGATWCI